MPFHTYIIYSDILRKFYIGHTGDELQGRLHKHLSDHNGYTAKAKDWLIVYFEIYDTKEAAYARERQIKGWKSTKMIRQLIAGYNSFGSEHPDL